MKKFSSLNMIKHQSKHSLLRVNSHLPRRYDLILIRAWFLLIKMMKVTKLKIDQIGVPKVHKTIKT